MASQNDSVGLLSRTNSFTSMNSTTTTTSESNNSSEEEFHLNMVNLGESMTGSLRHQDSQQVQASFQSSQMMRPNLMSMVHHKWKKMWKRDSAEITPNDPSYKTIYLGNVVTTWAKGEGCLDRPASALWKNHCQGRGSIKMVISVAPSGLKAQTREHGLTEYWANRLTWCGVPPDYPKLFCWIYRHEARKLKQELRCHAVLCTKEDRAARLADSLRNRLAEALFDFKKEKLLRQNARLSIVQSLYNTSATKRRLVLLNTNSQNYKPPLERSKSAPKLSCIEEFEEEDFDEGFDAIVGTIPESEQVPVKEITSTVLINHMLQTPMTQSVVSGSPRAIDSKLREEDEENDCDLLDDDDETTTVVTRNSAKNNDITNKSPSSPVEHRKSYAHPPKHHAESHAEATRRPHTVPMDAKLNLPYMTGYDKVMQLLEMPTSSDTHRLLMDGEDEFFPGSNSSDPVASSPGSDASESVVDSCCEDEFGKHIPRRRGSTERKPGDDSPGEEEINDNVSDESGYSEEATVVLRRTSGTSSNESSTDDQVTDLSLNLDPRGSPTLKKSSSTNTGKNFEKSTTIYIRGSNDHNEPVEISKLTTKGMNRSNCDGESPSCPTTTNTHTLMVFDNMCFEI